MQTFSSMRRNSTDYRNLKYILFVIILVIYQIAGSISTFLSPLVGVFFVYLLTTIQKENKNTRDQVNIYLIFLYFMFFELIRGFYLLGTLILFFIIFLFLKKRVISMFKSENWIIVIFVASAYFGLFLINNFFCYLQEKEFYSFSFIYIFYIFIDSLVSILLFKKR
jgi:hypothetical protein